MESVVFLSHVTRPGDPGWPQSPTLAVHPESQIASGDVANTYRLEMFNHFGTHIDSPNHFNPEGMPVVDMPPSRFIFRHPYLLDQPLGESELLMPEHLASQALHEADCLLIRSGFERWRSEDPVRYAEHGPGISAAAAAYMMESLPNLRMIVLDWLSISAYQNLPDGYQAHRILAGVQGHGRFIMGIEDATLKDLARAPHWVMTWPLRVQGTDGGPCTVVAGFEALGF